MSYLIVHTNIGCVCKFMATSNDYLTHMPKMVLLLIDSVSNNQ